MELDDLDLRLLRLLQEDARRSYRGLAQAAGSTTPTVGTRVRRMESLGVIRGYRVEVDPTMLEGDLQVLQARGAPAAVGALADMIAGLESAEQCYMLTGGRVMALVRVRKVRDLRDLHQKVAETPGVDEFDIHPVLGTRSCGAAGGELLQVHLSCHHCGKDVREDAVYAELGGRSHVFCCPLCRDAFEQRYRKLGGA